MKRKYPADDKLPSESQRRAEIQEAEALGIHKEPIDFYDPVVDALVESGHDEALWPSEAETVEELTK